MAHPCLDISEIQVDKIVVSPTIDGYIYHSYDRVGFLGYEDHPTGVFRIGPQKTYQVDYKCNG